MANKVDFASTAYSAVDDLNLWKPGLIQAPFASAGALLLAIAGILLSAIILALSDGTTLDSWEATARFTPATYLSIASTITNITLHFALDGGIAISWWRIALRPHTRIVDLHRAWSYGDSFFAALISFRNFNVIALASILITLAPINGPLLQRASRVTTENLVINRTLSIQIAPEIPQHYTAFISGHGMEPSLFTQRFGDVVQSYYRRDQIPTNSSCQSPCKSHVLGAGWGAYCQTTSISYNMSWPNFDTVRVFETTFAWDPSEASVISVGASFKPISGCVGDLVHRQCYLYATTVSYPVRVQSGSIALDPDSTIWNDVKIGPLPNPWSYREDNIAGKSTLGGIYWALNGRFGSKMSVYPAGAAGMEVAADGGAASAYAINMTKNLYMDCDIAFSDPMDDILAGARELIFRTAVDAALGNSSATENVPTTETVPHNIYRSNYTYLAIATTLSTLGVASVVATFGGFWTLGRRMTLSPIEIAKAFNAPILSSNDSNATVEELLDEVGAKPIRYGAVSVGSHTIGSASGQQQPLIRRNPLSEATTIHSENSDGGHDSMRSLYSGREAENTMEDDVQPLSRLQLAHPGVVEDLKRGGRYTG